MTSFVATSTVSYRRIRLSRAQLWQGKWASSYDEPCATLLDVGPPWWCLPFSRCERVFCGRRQSGGPCVGVARWVPWGVRWLLAWVLWLGVAACGSAQYEARSSYDAASPPAAPEGAIEAANAGYEATTASSEEDLASGSGERWSDDGAAAGFGGPPPQASASSSASQDETTTPLGAPDEQVKQAGANQTAPQANAAEAPRANAEPSANAQQRPKQLRLIYRAQLTLAVFETRATLDEIERMAQRLGGYLVHRSDEVIEVRVPVATFEHALKEASGLGDELSRQVTAEDVSDRYRDLNIRLRNAEVVRERLAALLARAADVKEALLVEEQLGRVTNTIEQIKGQLKVLDELIAYSTITVRLQPNRAHEQLAPRVAMPFSWLRDLGLSNLLNLEQR